MRMSLIQKRRGLEHGQSTTEFMLMIPVLFSMLFFVIEMGLYFTSVHYSTYAAFAAARSQQVGYSDQYGDAKAVTDLILTGALWGTATVNPVGNQSGVAIGLEDYQKLVPFPFIVSLLPNLKFETQVYLGINECRYEYATNSSRPIDQYDNNVNPVYCGS